GEENSPAERVAGPAAALQVPAEEARVRVALQHPHTHGAVDVAEPEPWVDVPGVGADVVPRHVDVVLAIAPVHDPLEAAGVPERHGDGRGGGRRGPGDGRETHKQQQLRAYLHGTLP